MKSHTGKLRRPLLVLGTILAGGAALGLPLSPANARQGAEQVIGDRSIGDAIEDEYLFDDAVPYDRIDVQAEDGLVTLSGGVSSLLVKRRARRIAETVKGVEAVVNGIDVAPALDRSATQIDASVEAALRRNPATESYEVSVLATGDGMVTLGGTVDSWAERDLAETVAAGVRGVTGIENAVAVEYDTTRADPTIETEVKERLKWSALVDSGLIGVAVEDGRVTLSGAVGSAAERRMAKTLAWVTGVTRVDTSALQVERWARDPDLRAMPRIISDATVREAVSRAILYDPRVDRENVAVTAEGGDVTLRGTVDSIAARLAAERLAENTTGVLDVENRLKVRLSEPVAEDELHDRIEAAFVDDPLIDATAVEVTVSDGTVWLYGSVDHYYEKGRVENVVAQVDGVTSIVNNLTVENPNRPFTFDPYVDPWPTRAYPWYDYEPGISLEEDREISREIDDQLWWSPYVDADEVTVTVADGIATLTGTVDSFAERRAAAQNAFQGGATWVVNKLDVDTGDT